MKKLIVLALIFAASTAYAPAFAGGCGGGGGGCGMGGGGTAPKGAEFSCSNQCPLAQAANTHRSTGSEAATTSSAVRATMTACVQRNLAKI